MLDILAFWLVWSVVSFFLHNLIHEGSHSIVGRLMGYETSMVLYPRMLPDGRFTFAHTKMSAPETLAGMERLRKRTSRGWFSTMYSLPFFSEIAWWCVAAWLSIELGTGGIVGMLVVTEMFSSAIDVSTGVAGFWTKRYLCDAERFVSFSGIPWWAGRALSIIPIVMFIVPLMAIARRLSMM